MAETDYLLLCRDGDGPQWTEAGKTKAHSRDAAVRKHADSGVWVAIPVRSWEPVDVGTKTITHKVLTPLPAKAPAPKGG